jgi:hypothetical protein
VQQLVLHLQQKHASNKQQTSKQQSQRSTPKKNCAQNIPTATAKDLRIRNAKIASGNAKSASVRKARKTSFGEVQKRSWM